MQLLNNFECDATPVLAGISYNLTLRAGREAPPANSKSVVMVLTDDSGKAARVLMDAVGSTYTITRIFSTTEANNAMPTFGSGLKALSSDVAEVLMIPFISAGIIYTGQSNAVGWNNGKANISRTIFTEADNRIKYWGSNHPSHSSAPRKIYALEGLYHRSYPFSGANNLGPYIPLAYRMLEDGYREICGILMAAGGQSIDIYIKGNTHYNALLNGLIDFVNESPLNKPVLWVQQQGETDQSQGMTPATWVARNKQFKDDIRGDLLAATGYDIYTIPFIAVGMHGDYRNGVNYDNVLDMEQGNADIPNNIEYSAYVPLGVGLSVTADAGEGGAVDDTHISASSYLTVADAIYDAIPSARMNANPSPDVTAPTLSVASGTQTGATTATGNVTTDEGNGTLFAYVTTSASADSATVIASGESQPVGTVGVQTVNLTGLTASTSYYIHYVHVDVAGNESSVLTSNQFATSGATDTTPPTLSSQTGTNVGHNAASGSVTTDEAGGTLFTYISTNSTELGTTVTSTGQTQAVSAAGVQNVSVTALTPSTTYYLHYVHRDAAGNDSAVASTTSFTTAAAPDTTAPVLTLPTATQTGQTTADGTVTTDEANGTLYVYLSANSTELIATVKTGATQAVTATGVQNVSITGLTAATTYYAHYVHTDSAGNDSAVASSTSFTTQSAGPSHPLIDALAPTHHFRSDAGLNTGSGNDFASWVNQGSGDDITTVIGGNPQVGANGLLMDGDDAVEMPVNGLTTNTTGSSIVIKYKAAATGWLMMGFGSGIALGDGIVGAAKDTVFWQGFLGPNQITVGTELGDDVEHVLAITIEDGGQMDVYLDGTNIGSIAAGAINTSTTELFVGAHSAPQDFMNGYVKAIVAKPAVKWTPQQIADITSELP